MKTPDPQTTKDESEHIRISITYTNDLDGARCERLEHSVSFDGVPNQSKVWDRAKQMVDILYTQVRG